MNNSIRELSKIELSVVTGGNADCGNVPVYWDGNPFPISDPDFQFPKPPPEYAPLGKG